MITTRVAQGAALLLTLLLAAATSRADKAPTYRAPAGGADEPYTYLSATAREGDGAFTLLRRYDLPLSSCYQEKFAHLNGLSSVKQAIRAGRDYQLPVLVYRYDGRSIRTTLGIDDLPLAREIQAYNRARERDGQQEGPYERTRALWVPYGKLFCDAGRADLVREDSDVPTPGEPMTPTPLIPAEASAVTVANAARASPVGGYAIFGEKYARVERVDDALAGKDFYLVSGHGGPDPGALGTRRKHRLCEDEYAYDVVLRLARNIIAHGGVPYVIIRDPDDGIRDDELLDCDYDEVVWGEEAIPRGQVARLRQRSNAINALARKSRAVGVKDQFCVVVHVDSRSADNQTDLFLYHQLDNSTSLRMGEAIRASMVRNYARNKRSREYQGVLRARDLHMLREVSVPTVYIELGNIQHAFDQKRVVQVENRQALANWFTEGIIEGAR